LTSNTCREVVIKNYKNWQIKKKKNEIKTFKNVSFVNPIWRNKVFSYIMYDNFNWALH